MWKSSLFFATARRSYKESATLQQLVLSDLLPCHSGGAAEEASLEREGAQREGAQRECAQRVCSESVLRECAQRVCSERGRT